VKGFECQEDFKVDKDVDWEPVKFLKDSGDMLRRRGSGDDADSTVLDQLNFIEKFVW